MQILTPENAAFLPNGTGGGSDGPKLSASYELVETVGADFPNTNADWFTPTDGLYLWCIWLRIVNSDSGVGSMGLSVIQPGSTASPIAESLSSVNTDDFVSGFNSQALLASGGVVQVGRSLAGFGGTTLTYRIRASAFFLC